VAFSWLFVTSIAVLHYEFPGEKAAFLPIFVCINDKSHEMARGCLHSERSPCRPKSHQLFHSGFQDPPPEDSSLFGISATLATVLISL
jgi:hypothetical protein